MGWRIHLVDNPSARLLRLLVLLQARSRWSGRELAGRLEVSVRTLRYDIDKLRQLGYPVLSGTGAAGGYELQPGPVLPPLLLDDDEAVAMAIGLQLAAGAGGDLGEPASTALAKLHQLLPRRLYGRITALRRYTASVPHGSSMVELAVVTFLTSACRCHQRVRFAYTSRDGAISRRDVEPYRVLQLDGRWYLVTFDPQRDDWRSFRLDRLQVSKPAGARFSPRTPPEPAALLHSIDAAFRRHQATVIVAAAAEIVAARLPTSVPVETVDPGHCRVFATGDTAYSAAMNLLLLDQEFVVENTSPAVRAALQTISQRAAQAGTPPQPPA